MLKLTLIFIACSLTLINAQSKKNEILRKIKEDPFIKAERVYEKTGDEIYKLTYLPSGRITYKNFRDYGTFNQTKYDSVSKTIINLANIDTTLYSGMYYYWKDIDIYSSHTLLKFADINNNGLLEVYGVLRDKVNHRNEWGIFEFDSLFETYNYLHQYIEEPDSICVENTYSGFADIYDINGNGREQVYLMSNCSVSHNSGYEPYEVAKVFSNTNEFELPVHKDFEYIEVGQLDYSQFGDFDNDNNTDLIYFNSGINEVKINRYNASENNFNHVYTYSLTSSELAGAGFYIDDVDKDGNVEMTFGGVEGDVWVFEYNPDNLSYGISYRSVLPTFNVYVHFGTNDIDRNGKKEFWMGGDAFYDDEPITVIACFEPVGIDSFEVVHIIEIEGLFSFDAYNGLSADINNDGDEELFFCFENNIFIFDFIGELNSPQYSLYYYKVLPTSKPPHYLVYNNAITYDINRNGAKEILICYDELLFGGGFRKGLTSIYTAYDPTGINEAPDNILDFNLSQNYPNPFNPITTISYSIPKGETITIKVFNLLGELVAELVNKEQRKGKYKVKFNGNNLPSGIYLIQLTAGSYQQTIKAVLIK